MVTTDSWAMEISASGISFSCSKSDSYFSAVCSIELSTGTGSNSSSGFFTSWRELCRSNFYTGLSCFSSATPISDSTSSYSSVSSL